MVFGAFGPCFVFYAYLRRDASFAPTEAFFTLLGPVRQFPIKYRGN